MSVAEKDRFQETALGWIPATWDCLSQSEVVTFHNGRAYKLTEWETEGTPVIRLQNLTGSSETYYYSNLKLPPHQYVNKGDLLFMWSATFGPHIWRGEKAIYHYHIWKIDCSERLDRSYMFYSLSRFTDEMKNKTNGSTMLHLTKAGMEKELIVLPPLPEQRKIAAILTTVDDKLDVIARQIKATQTLKQGLMQALFSRGVGTQDVTGRWLQHTEFKGSEVGDIPVGWEVRTLESVATVDRGRFSARPRNDPKYFENGDIPFVQTGDIASVPRYIENASQFLNADGLAVSKCFPAGTIFITIAANIGDVAIAKIPMACPDSLVGINTRSDVCDNTWLYYLLSHNKDYFDSQSTQNAQKNINLQVLKPFLFPLPILKEQQRIAGVLTALDDKLAVLVSRQIHCQMLKRGLMQKLLTGEWRVKLDDPIGTA
jgi:type I restriction enzyme S subunit